MAAALLVDRVLLASIFAFAGVAKLADLAGSRRAVAEFGVPARIAGVAGVMLPAAEIAVAVALVISASARFGAVGAGVLLLGFIAAIGNALARGRAPDCHCFGQVHGAPAGWRTLGRNLVLLGLAAFAAAGGWRHPGISATHWLIGVSAPWLVGIAAGLVIAGLIAFQVWFSLQLLSQNGRTISRLEALEAAIAGGRGEGDTGTPGRPMALGAGLSGGGLPVGTEAPKFSLESVGGEQYSLTSLLSGERALLLVFSDAGCGPCDALLPELAAWQEEHADSLQIVVIASGDQQRNRAKAEEHGLAPVLIQPEREVSEAYEAPGTPMAVAIGPDGVIRSPAVGGADAIRALVAQATSPMLAVRQVAANGDRDGNLAQAVPGNGNGNGNGGQPGPDVSRVGTPAPDLELADLAGEPFALRTLYEEPTVAIFWNPGCGFCRQMLPDLLALQANPPSGTPGMVVISSGAVGQTREDGLGSPVLADPQSEAMRAFGAGGTPMAVLIEDGRIASPVAAGADAVFALIRSSSRPAEPAPGAADGIANGNGRGS